MFGSFSLTGGEACCSEDRGRYGCAWASDGSRCFKKVDAGRKN